MRFRLPSLTERLVEGVLASVVGGDHMVDLRDSALSPVVANWRDGSNWTRSFGAVASSMHHFAFTPISPGREFDGLGYVHRGGPPTLMPDQMCSSSPAGPA